MHPSARHDRKLLETEQHELTVVAHDRDMVVLGSDRADDGDLDLVAQVHDLAALARLGEQLVGNRREAFPRDEASSS